MQCQHDVVSFNMGVSGKHRSIDPPTHPGGLLVVKTWGVRVVKTWGHGWVQILVENIAAPRSSKDTKRGHFHRHFHPHFHRHFHPPISTLFHPPIHLLFSPSTSPTSSHPSFAHRGFKLVQVGFSLWVKPACWLFLTQGACPRS